MIDREAMIERRKIEATAAANARQKSLELLFDYTKFHIGIYLTLTAAYITVATAKFGDQRLVTLVPRYVWVAILAFMLAGLAAGVIVSSITQSDAGSTRKFLDERIGLWNWKKTHFSARKWTYIEHTSFWVGLIAAVLSFRSAI